MDFIYYIFKDFLHYAALAFLVILVPAAIIGVIKPGIITKRIRLFSSRKNSAAGSLVSIVLLVGLVLVTGPTMAQQQRLDKETADKQQLAKLQKKVGASEEKTIDIKLLKKAEAIPYERQEKLDGSLPAGQNKVAQKGVIGEKTLTYELTFEDGLEVDRKLKKEVVTRKPVAQIVLIGTAKSSSQTTNSNKPRGSLGQSNNYCKPAYRGYWFYDFYCGG